MQYLRERGFSPALLQVGLVLVGMLLALTVRVGPPGCALQPPPQVGTDKPILSASRACTNRAETGGRPGSARRDALRRIGQPLPRLGVEPEANPALARADRNARGRRVRPSHRLHTKRPLERGETLLGRAREIDADLGFAIALRDAG